MQNMAVSNFRPKISSHQYVVSFPKIEILNYKNQQWSCQHTVICQTMINWNNKTNCSGVRFVSGMLSKQFKWRRYQYNVIPRCMHMQKRRTPKNIMELIYVASPLSCRCWQPQSKLHQHFLALALKWEVECSMNWTNGKSKGRKWYVICSLREKGARSRRFHFSAERYRHQFISFNHGFTENSREDSAKSFCDWLSQAKE